MYPFERYIEPELYTVVEVLPEHSPIGPYGCKPWFAAYEKYGLFGEARYLPDSDFYKGRLATDWPALDLENYTYIITFCQEIETLSYNVWEVITTPTYTAAKAGHIVFKEEINPFNIYIYQIPKMRIDNDSI